MKNLRQLMMTLLVTVLLVNASLVAGYAASNPSRNEIYETMITVGKEYNIPPEILYAVGYTESNLKQYNQQGQPLISPDGGIGIMQVTPQYISQTFDQSQLKYNWKYNIKAGAQILNSKWELKNKITTHKGQTGSWLPVIGDGNPMVLENWYFALWAYNGFAGENNPNELPKWIDYVGDGYQKNKAYQEKVISAADKLGFSITEIPADRLPQTGVPAVGSSYQIPQPKHYSQISDQVDLTPTPQVNLVTNGLHAASFANFPQVEIAARISNRHDQPIEDSFQVTLYNNGQVLSKEISGLRARETKEVIFNPEYEQPGDYGYSLLLDSGAEIAEGNESDNKTTGIIKVKQEGHKKVETVVNTTSGGDISRNLRVEQLKVLGKRRTSGNYKLAAVVVNTGNAPIKRKTYATLYFDGQTYRVPVEKLAAEEEKQVIFNTGSSYPDVYDYSVLVDSTGLIREANENDNRMTGTVELRNVNYADSTNTDLTLTYPDQIIKGDKVQFRGAVSEKADKIVASVDGYKLAEKPVTETNNFQFAHQFSQAGRNRTLVIKSFTSSGELVEKLINRIRVFKEQKLTVNHPEPIITQEEFKLTGQALKPIHKVIISMDGYLLEEEVVKDGIYRVKLTINQPGEARELVVKAFDRQGKAVKEIKKQVSVLSQRQLTVTSPAEVEVDEEFTVAGQALAPIDKVIISVDGWKLTEESITNGQYETDLKLNQDGSKRKLVVKGFKADGTAVKEVSKRINVGSDEIITGVPYFYQHYNDYSPGGSCQNTSTAMVLNYYGWTGTPDDITAEWGTEEGKTPEGLAKVFNSYAREAGLDVRLEGHRWGTMSDINALLAEGKPVIVHGWFTSYGHVIVLVGYDGTYYYANDSAGRWDQNYNGGYYHASRAGKYVKYYKSNLRSVIKSGGTLWYHELYFVD